VADDERRDGASRKEDYRLARVAVAGGMSTILGILLLLDAVSPDYTMQATTLTVIVTMIVVLLGVETVSMWRGGGK
jgi:hypothetical protein